ncbi:MAG: hypothetical protein GYB64_05285 [Chloroflexi bacterium]|nr:hypothetical protein [Chloroflexota bacterium]
MVKRFPGVTAAALLAAAAGGWLIAASLRVALPPLAEIWPVILIVAAAALIAQVNAERRRRPAVMLPGTILLLCGLFFLLFTLGIGRLGWVDLLRLWPVFPLIIATGYLMVYLAGDMQEQALLVPVYVFGAIGLIALPLTLGAVQTLAFRQTLRLWPLVLVLLALFVFARPRQD